MIGKVVTGCVAILPYHTATQDRGSECRDFGFISRIVTALFNSVTESSESLYSEPETEREIIYQLIKHTPLEHETRPHKNELFLCLESDQ